MDESIYDRFELNATHPRIWPKINRYGKNTIDAVHSCGKALALMMMIIITAFLLSMLSRR